PFEHLGQDVRRPLAGDVHAAELRYRIVAVLGEHPLVELLGARRADGGGRDSARRPLEEFIQEKPAERLRRSGGAGEERGLADLGQVDEGEDGPVEVGEVGRERGPLLGAERVHTDILAPGRSPGTRSLRYGAGRRRLAG